MKKRCDSLSEIMEKERKKFDTMVSHRFIIPEFQNVYICMDCNKLLMLLDKNSICKPVKLRRGKK